MKLERRKPLPRSFGFLRQPATAVYRTTSWLALAAAMGIIVAFTWESWQTKTSRRDLPSSPRAPALPSAPPLADSQALAPVLPGINPAPAFRIPAAFAGSTPSGVASMRPRVPGGDSIRIGRFSVQEFEDLEKKQIKLMFLGRAMRGSRPCPRAQLKVHVRMDGRDAVAEAKADDGGFFLIPVKIEAVPGTSVAWELHGFMPGVGMAKRTGRHTARSDQPQARVLAPLHF